MTNRKLFALGILLASCPLAAAGQSPIVTAPLAVTAAPVGESLTNPPPEEARRELGRVPGATALVPAESWRGGKATNVADVLGFVPGVFAQPKYGQEDARLAIRGSGLSRNFHLRGTRLLQDGVPVNATDGSGDFHEIDPLAFRYVEVFRGGNGLQMGAASLGGAINYVSPTGHDFAGQLLRGEAGSFNTTRGQFAHGVASGPVDAFVTPTWSASDGLRVGRGQGRL